MENFIIGLGIGLAIAIIVLVAMAVSSHKKLLALRNVDADSIDIEAEHTDFAVKHFAIIAKFGRYPYRNQVLGRENTPEEQIWLDNGAETFGQ